MSRSLPRHALRVRTYDELASYVRAFAQGHLNLLMVFGPPGVGKSRCVRQALPGKTCWIGAQATPHRHGVRLLPVATQRELS